jgi:hypothetical protein
MSNERGFPVGTASYLSDLFSRTFSTMLPASAATTAAIAICGQLEDGNSLPALNAVSHIPWGDEAAEQEDASLKYTATGTILNTIAVGSWALVYEAVFGKAARRGQKSTAILGGIAVSGLAYVTDYYVVPKRLTPGFEKRLSPASMLAVYSALALSLPLASLLETKPVPIAREGKAKRSAKRTRSPSRRITHRGSR